MINNKNSIGYTINVKFNNKVENDISIKNIDQDTAKILLVLLGDNNFMSIIKTFQNVYEVNMYMKFSNDFQDKIKNLHKTNSFEVIAEKIFEISIQNEHRGRYIWFNTFYTKRVQIIKQQLENIVKNNFDSTVKNKNSIFFHDKRRSYYSSIGTNL